MNFWGLSNLDTEWKNHKCARMRCKLPFYLTLFVSWNDNWQIPLIFLGMNWCDSVGEKIPLKGLHSLSSGNNWNGWCYTIVIIWIWPTQSIVTHLLMTLTATKERKLKVLLCNLHVDLHVRGLDMMTSWHSARFSAVDVSKRRLAVYFPVSSLRNVLNKGNPTN